MRSRAVYRAAVSLRVDVEDGSRRTAALEQSAAAQAEAMARANRDQARLWRAVENANVSRGEALAELEANREDQHRALWEALDARSGELWSALGAEVEGLRRELAAHREALDGGRSDGDAALYDALNARTEAPISRLESLRRDIDDSFVEARAAADRRSDELWASLAEREQHLWRAIEAREAAEQALWAALDARVRPLETQARGRRAQLARALRSALGRLRRRTPPER